MGNLHARAELSAILASLGEGLIVVNQDLKITYVNPKASRLLGRSHEELFDVDVRVILSFWKDGCLQTGQDFPLMLVQKAKLPINADEDGNYKLQVWNGRMFPVEFSITPLLNEFESVGAVLVFKDISDHLALREARNQFLSIASHQLRSPLIPIKWFTQLLLSGQAGNLTNDQKVFVEYIAENSNRMLELLNALLQMSRLEGGRIKITPTPEDLLNLVKQVVESLQPVISQKQLKLIIHEPPVALPLIIIDRIIVWQVILNLLTNAIRYSHSAGKIEVFLEHAGGFLRVKIQDFGIGIPKSYGDKIFERFTRTPEAVKLVPEGSGLGLALVKTLVEDWGGKIWYESVEKEGTTFLFTLPLSGMKARNGDVTLEV